MFLTINLSAQSKISEKPNLLIIINDQWRGEAVGYEGKEPVKTPNLDAFAKESFVSKQMVTNYPLCSPSRAMLFSGRYPLKNKVFSNVNSRGTPFGIELPTDMTCISDVLKSSGYFNGYIGKWHLDAPHEPYINTSNNKEVAWNEWTPPNRRHGYDYWYAYGTYDEHDKPMYWNTNDPRDSFHYVNEWGPKHEADKAIAFFKNEGNVRPADKPFSLVVSMNPPHTGYKSVPKKYYNLYKDVSLETLIKDPDIPAADTKMGKLYRDNIKYYYANITGADEQIGRILDYLKQSGLQKNTLIIFMADHGNSLGKHEEVSKNHFYEESVRIPFIMHWDGKILARFDNQMLMSEPDIFPTVLNIMGVKTPLPTDIDGRDFSKYITSGKGDYPNLQYIMGSVTAGKSNTGFRGVRTTQYKLVYDLKGKNLNKYLFDIQKDPFELSNLYNSNTEVVKTLKKDLKAWLKQTGDNFDIEK
ncbi:sulfatase family protein [Pedobacter arcticus]|uniref:sulfatase family protein n=1 Tax=Pedobacter arcticus TaxID=752140 RepID=UPI0002DBA976|nr:sulfatase [Pedobacter arcticus]